MPLHVPCLGAPCCESGTCSFVKVPGYAGLWGVQKKPTSLPWSHHLPHTGVKIIFRVGLVLLKHALGSPEKLKACQGQYETIEQLRSLSPKIMQEAFLVQEVRPTPPTCYRREGELAMALEETLHAPAPRVGQPGSGWMDLILLLGEWSTEA